MPNRKRAARCVRASAGNVDVIRFRKEAVAEAEAFPVELMLEEAVNAVQTAVLGSAFNDEIVTFEVILVSVIAEAFGHR